MTDHCAFGHHGPCPETATTCSCGCHYEIPPPFTRHQRSAIFAFFVIPIILIPLLAWKP